MRIVRATVRRLYDSLSLQHSCVYTAQREAYANIDDDDMGTNPYAQWEPPQVDFKDYIEADDSMAQAPVPAHAPAVSTSQFIEAKAARNWNAEYQVRISMTGLI